MQVRKPLRTHSTKQWKKAILGEIVLFYDVLSLNIDLHEDFVLIEIKQTGKIKGQDRRDPIVWTEAIH